jgi:hypothetical protein
MNTFSRLEVERLLLSFTEQEDSKASSLMSSYQQRSKQVLLTSIVSVGDLLSTQTSICVLSFQSVAISFATIICELMVEFCISRSFDTSKNGPMICKNDVNDI